jgi:hypothetical protein
MAVNSTDIEIIKHNNISIYTSDIDLLTEEYIQTLDNPEMIYKSLVFTGMLEFIYDHLLKNILADTKQNDYKLLNDIFYKIYIKLCYKYNINPSILGFCNLCHIDNSNITDIKNGIYRTSGFKVNPETTQLVKNWYTVVESGLYSKVASENSIGAIFLLKAGFNYSDAQTININTNTDIQHDTAEQIAARHSGAQLPEKIDL